MTQIILAVALLIIAAVALVAISNDAAHLYDNTKPAAAPSVNTGNIYRAIYYVVRELNEDGTEQMSFFPSHTLADAFRTYDWAIKMRTAHTVVMDQFVNAGTLYAAVMAGKPTAEYYAGLRTVRVAQHNINA